jgi:hypothetical protein
MMNLINDEHARVDLCEQVGDLDLLAACRGLRTIRCVQVFKNGVVEPCFVRHRGSLYKEHRDRRLFSFWTISLRVHASEALDQRRLAIVGLAYEQQIRHAVRARVAQQPIKLAKNLPGLRIADPTGLAEK